MILFGLGSNCMTPDPCKEGADNWAGEVVACDDETSTKSKTARDAGLVLSKTSVSVNESGTTDTFTIRLNDQPEANVYLSLSASDSSEASVSPSSLVFTNIRWDLAQTVTVTGVDDALGDDNITSTISIGVNDDTTYDPYYDAVDNSTVSVTTIDNDVIGFTLSKTSSTVTELGSTDNFNIVLTLAPTGNVVINLTASDTGEATVSHSSFTYSTGNWSTPQIGTITGIYDTTVDGNVNSTITASINDGASADEYDPLADQTIAVSTTDSGHTIGFTLSKTTAATSETGSTDTFTVVLKSIPESNVVIDIADNDTNEAQRSPTSLTFTNSNWSTAQTVTVTGVDDNVVDGSQSVLLTLSVNDGSSFDAYDSVADQTVTVTNSDAGDSANFTVTETSGSTSFAENGTDNFTVILTSEPLANVVYSVTASDTDEFTVSPSTLTFTPSNWNTAQAVTTSGVNDNAIDGTAWGTATVAVSSTVDATYASMGNKTISTTITDIRSGSPFRPNISAGDYFFCSQDNDGSQTIYCWGDDTCLEESYGYCDYDMSDGTTAHTIGSGAVYPHMPDDSHLGDNTSTSPRAMPMSVLPTNAQRFVSEDEWSCAVTSTGNNVTCWGRYRMSNFGSSSGQIWSSSYANNSIRDIDIGYEHGCVLWDNQTVSCWGYGRFGSIGNGVRTYNDPGSVATGVTNVTDLAAGYQHNCVIHDNQTVSCWGRDNNGQLGDSDSGANAGICSSTACSLTVVPLSGGISNFIQIDAGANTTCGVLDNGSVVCWGAGEEGQLGNGSNTTTQDSPVYVTGITTATRVSVGHTSACAVLDNRTTMKCWGEFYLGDSNSVSSNVPVTVVEANGWTSNHRYDDIEVGYRSVCVYDKAHEDIFCWGINTSGQVGVGNTTSPYATMQKVGAPF
jgi:alpha-tubulin suppressor-like RCC1 family protein